MNVVLDTNVLLSSLAKKSPYRLIFDELLHGTFNLTLSNDILMEYEEIIGQRASPIVSENVLELFANLPNVEQVEIYYYWDLIIEDPDDNKFSDCAIAASVDYLVSNDRHFHVLKSIDFPPVNLISMGEFMDLLNEIN